MIEAEVWCDGSLEGNGYIIKIWKDDVVTKELFGQFSYPEIFSTTCNESEYFGLLNALERVKSEKEQYDSISIYSDSDLMVKQINGKYRVKNHNLKAYYQLAKIKLFQLGSPYVIHHIPGIENISDRLTRGIKLPKGESNEW